MAAAAEPGTDLVAEPSQVDNTTIAESKTPATSGSASPSAASSMLPVVSGEGFPSVTDVLAQPAVRKVTFFDAVTSRTSRSETPEYATKQ